MPVLTLAPVALLVGGVMFMMLSEEPKAHGRWRLCGPPPSNWVLVCIRHREASLQPICSQLVIDHLDAVT